MKQLTKTQMRVIITLNVVIVVLLCGLFFNYPLVESPVGGSLVDAEHNIKRNARVSLNVDLDFETNVGGSGDEELVACFASSDQTKIHIFGNSNSIDYDFKELGSGIFFVMTDRKAQIEKILRFGDSGDVLRKVILAEGGYLLGIDNITAKTTRLLLISPSGEIIKSLEHGIVSEERISDLLLMENGYLLIVQTGISLINFYDIKVFFYGLDLKDEGAVVISNASYSQEYVAILPKGLDKYIMAVNYSSELWRGMAIVEISKATSQSKKIILENNYLSKGFMPVNGGYVALIIDVEGRSSIITLSATDFSIREKKYLATSTDTAALFFANSNYYAHIKTAELSAVFRFDLNLSGYEDIALFRQAGTIHISYIRNSGVIYACGDEDAILVGLSDTQNWFKKFGSLSEETNTKLVFLNDEMFLICESNGKDGDVGGNFGKKDIWLAKVSI